MSLLMNPGAEADALRARMLELLGRMKGKKVLLVGDMVADHYIYGKTSRISREAPVLILKYQEQYTVPGQAGNTACNVASLGGVVTAVGVVGKDVTGQNLKNALKTRGVSVDGLIELKNYSTMAKTRILAGGHHTCRQQVIRIDDDARPEPNGAVEALVLQKIETYGKSADALIVSDYGYGMVSPVVWNCAVRLKNERGIPLILDSRYRLPGLKGASLITPNEEEALAAAGIENENTYNVSEIGRLLLRKTGADSVLITRGNEGMVLFKPRKQPHAIGIFGTDEVTDVTGAGDTVVASSSLSLAAGASLEDAAEMANVAAGVVVMKIGTATVSRQELEQAIRTGKTPVQ